MLKNRDIICVSSIDWDFVWQGHQEIMSAFATSGNRVLYIENTGIRSPRISDLSRIASRIRNWSKWLRGIRQESRNLFICSPLILPFPYSRIAKFFNRFLLLNNIKAWMRAANFKDPVIWTFLPNSLSIDIIDNIDHSLAVYYCIAEFSVLADSSRKVNKAEAELLKRCDIVFAQGEVIKTRCLRFNRNVHIFPFGVRGDIFSRPAGEDIGPADLRRIKRPVLGYVGGIHKHIDFRMLAELARKEKDASLVLVGPVQTDEADTLKGMGNVHFLGKKEHAELPSYIDAFDLCLIPYLITEYTKTVYPTKLNEYLMRGKRVLSTPLPEVEKFVRDFGDVVSISEADLFAERAGELLKEPPSAGFQAKAKAVALKNNWPRIIEEMSDLIEKGIEKRQKDALSEWRDNFIRMTKKAKGKVLAAGAVFAVSYVLLFHTPLLWWAASPLKVATPLAKADIIIVLGGGVGETNRGGQGYEERVKYACELYQKGYAGKILFSSGWIYAFQEADVMKALAISAGVRGSDIVIEKGSKSTYDSIKNSLAIAEKAGYRRIIWVSSPYHMLRVKLTAEKTGKSESSIYSPIPYSMFYGDGKSVQFRHIKAIIHEYMGLLYYWLKGLA